MDDDTLSKWHDHLDACEMCRTKPWELCPKGRDLLKAAALDVGFQGLFRAPLAMLRHDVTEENR